MRLYVIIILCIVFLVVNYYVIEFAYMGMTYNNDFTFIVGLLGLALLIVSDILITIRVFKNCLPKGEGK